ncbi:MAG: hypothetical protein KKH44_05330, partial [Bacteroidetes bacterium]|nr:hypothetical protein [Bacteroidota bacterium]
MATLTQQQQQQYYESQRNAANPLSPTDWLNQQSTNTMDGTQNNNTSTTPTPTTGYGRTNVSEWDNPFYKNQVGFVEASAESAGLISASFIDTLTGEDVAFYARALGAGGYTTGDILNDIKRREMADPKYGNNPEARDLKIIDDMMDRVSYLRTPDGQNSVQTTSTLIPTFNFQGLLNPEMFKYGVMDMPDEFWEMIVPTLDRESQEFKDAVANVKSAFYDLTNQQLQADTKEAKVIADKNYADFKEDVEKHYGIALSDDAIKAWAQIEGLKESFSQRGISGSGLESESIDKTLFETRKQDQRLRDEKLTAEERQQATYYRASASPEQINNLVQQMNAEDAANGITDPEKMRSFLWGLTPSKEILDMYDMENLKARYPNKSVEWLQNQRDQVLDKNGNLTSSIYKNYYKDLGTNMDSELTAAEGTVIQEALDKANLNWTVTTLPLYTLEKIFFKVEHKA